jgi:hypothetical protein
MRGLYVDRAEEQSSQTSCRVGRNVKPAKMSRFRVKLVPVPAEHPAKRDSTLADPVNLRPAGDESNGMDQDYRVYVYHPLIRSHSDGQARAEALTLLGLALGRGAALLALGAIRVGVKAYKTARDISERQFTKQIASESAASRKPPRERNALITRSSATKPI